MSTNTDIAEIRGGDISTYWQLFDREFARCYMFAQAFTKNELASENVVRNAMLRLWTEREMLPEGVESDTVLLGLLREEIAIHLASSLDACADVERKEREEEQVRLCKRGDKESFVARDAVEAMPARRREIFLLSREKMLTNTEIAKLMNISVRTVEKHIELAKKQLQEKTMEG